VHDSAEMVRAFLEAEDIARRATQTPSSAHLLLALFTFPNRAQVLLSERKLDEDLILNAIRVMEDEPTGTLGHLRERAREIARGAGSTDVDCLHVLIALTRQRDAFAYRLLERTGASLTALRNVAVSFVTGNMPRRYRTLGAPGETSSASAVPPGRRLAPERVVERERDAPSRESEEDPDKDDFESLSELIDAAAESGEVGSAPSDPVTPPLTPAARPDRPEAAPAPSPVPDRLAVRPSPRVESRSAAASRAPKPKTLAERAPTLTACGVDLTERARQGRLDRAIGRDRELEALIDILGKRRANNPVLVGPPGVGKTAIVEGLAVKIARGDDDVKDLHHRVLFALDTGALVAGTSLRGAFSERLGAIKSEVAEAKGDIVVFIDELHTLIGAGSSGEGAQDAANELKAALARGDFPCIGATTLDEFRKHIEKDAALERRFTPVQVNEPTVDEAILILEGAIAPYAEHHGVAYGLDAVHAAVQLSHRFINERKLPDKAFAVLDLAGSRARRRGAPRVERIDVARVVHEWSSVPLERLAEADADRFARAEELIAEKLVGHREVVAAVCRSLRRGFAGFNGKRPMGSFLFLGPTGVGKTELVKILAEFLFGRTDALVRVDMSELSEPHAVARLIGAQPGYVGYEEGGQLTEALRRRPFQIVLFDEIEKAHREVLALLLQILDEGHLTDARGRRVSFTSTLVVLTSNLGAERLASGGKPIGFSGDASSASARDWVLDAARSRLPPELWGRLDERLVFAPLRRDELRQIALLQLGESARELFAEREISLTWDSAIADFLLERGGFTPVTGARGMRQALQREIEAPIAERVLSGELSSGDIVELAVHGGALQVRPSESTRRRRHGSP
jgi:ATP-dependent Clp protease ATP-binding subunit ClpC